LIEKKAVQLKNKVNINNKKIKIIKKVNPKIKVNINNKKTGINRLRLRMKKLFYKRYIFRKVFKDLKLQFVLWTLIKYLIIKCPSLGFRYQCFLYQIRLGKITPLKMTPVLLKFIKFISNVIRNKNYYFRIIKSVKFLKIISKK